MASQARREAISFGIQTNALLRKNAVYQKRRICLNSCILVLPLLFILLLFLLQTYIDTLLDDRDNRCGCMCIQCCGRFGGPCREADETSQCVHYDEVCRKYNDDVCEAQYSDTDQITFCEIRNPIIWPALLDIPYSYRRPGRWEPDVVLFTTAENPNVEQAMNSSLFPEANLSSNAGNLTVDVGDIGEILSSDGFVFGSPEEPDTQNYIDPAFENYGLSLLSRNCSGETATLDAIKEDLDQASQQLPGQLGSFIRFEVSRCANVKLLSRNEAEINRFIFCSFKDARCNATSEELGIPFSESNTDAPDQFTQAMDFKGTTKTKLEADFWIKDWGFVEDEDSDGSSRRRASQPINMMAKAWLEYATSGHQYTSQLLGIQETPKQGTQLNFEITSLIAILLFTWVIQMMLPVMLVQLVYEKEEHLRIMMKMHGLGDEAYWLINYAYYFIIYCLYAALLVGLGSATDIAIFTNNNYGVQLLFLFLFGNVQIAFTFVLSSLFHTTRSCVIFSFLWIFGSGLIGDFLLSNLIAQDRWYLYLVELIPPFTAYRGFYELGQYGFRASAYNREGLTFSSFDEDNNHMGYLLTMLLFEWIVFTFLAWYLEQTNVSGSGVAKHPLFFLDYFKKRSGFEDLDKATELTTQEPDRKASAGNSSDKIVNMTAGNEATDEASERRRVEGFTVEDTEQHSIIINRLRKVFPAYEGTPEKVAVKGLTMAVQKGEVFGLLGPNGAGKTTTINMLIGFAEPSDGTAKIEGYDIRTDMDTLYALMGVCPQHNLLWATLTGLEHLYFYGRLKGLKNDELTNASEAALKAVNLFHGGVGKKQVKTYSGGMKRRLSVAISLIGNPRVAFLDEPSTGLDPASRRNLWKVVRDAKQNKAIILTTHNMEEAEVLCDRLGIFVDGQLHVIGNPKNLTARYGGYLVFTLITVPALVQSATKHVKRQWPNAVQSYAVGGTLKFELSSREVSPSHVFRFVEDIRSAIQVLDWGVASATLEEVFIKIAKAAGARSNELP